MNKTPEAVLLKCRIKRASRGYSGRTARCEACGNPCLPANRDRFGYLPPAGCSTTCVERAIQARAKAKENPCA